MKKLRLILVGLVVAALAWAAWPALAVRVVNYTLQPVTAADCIAVGVSKQTNGQGGTVLVTTFTFAVRDETGTVRETGASTFQLTPAQASSLATFITNNGVPVFNSENNL